MVNDVDPAVVVEDEIQLIAEIRTLVATTIFAEELDGVDFIEAAMILAEIRVDSKQRFAPASPEEARMFVEHARFGPTAADKKPDQEKHTAKWHAEQKQENLAPIQPTDREGSKKVRERQTLV
jgi:hypothetical protein